jgi:hypothetical protein
MAEGVNEPNENLESKKLLANEMESPGISNNLYSSNANLDKLN